MYCVYVFVYVCMYEYKYGRDALLRATQGIGARLCAVSMYVCMYVYMGIIRTHAWMCSFYMYVCMYVCMYVSV